MDLAEVYILLNNAVHAAGTQKAFAERAGITATYLHDVLNGRRDPGPKILKALSLRKVTRYERIKTE